MDVVGVLRMNEGEGKTSYAQNSWIPQEVFRLTKPAREEAIRITYDTFFPARSNHLVIAELGCSSGPAALSFVRELIESIEKIHHSSSSSVVSNQQGGQYRSPNLHFYLNDLPHNDFNTIFKSLPSFHEKLKKERRYGGGAAAGEYFIYGVAGSFYGPLFESRSLHFIYSSYSVHWLSKVPERLGRKNEESIQLSRRSPAMVVNAYYQQFQSDFSTFLQYRSQELNDGGCMVLTLIGRHEDQFIEDSGSAYQLLAEALNQMVLEGSIDKEKMDLFNIPIYHPSIEEITDVVVKEGSFTVIRLQESEVTWNPTVSTANKYNYEKREREDHDSNRNNTKSSRFIPFVQCMRAVFEPLLVDHFGETIVEDVFKRYNDVAFDFFAKRNDIFFNITISLMKNSEVKTVGYALAD